LVSGLESFALKKKGASGIFIFMKNICERVRLTNMRRIKKDFLEGKTAGKIFARAKLFADR
jgi:hypothetical protein